MLRDFLDQNPKRKNARHMGTTTMLVTVLNDRVATVIHCVVEKKNSEGDRWKEYSYIYRLIEKTATKL